MAKQNINQFLQDNPEEWYYPEALKSGVFTEKEMRKQYTYFRDVAMKRLKRLGESEFADSQAYLKNIKQFKKLSQIETESELVTRLYTIQKFLRSKGSTISGQKAIRKKAVEAAQEKGLDFINESNIADFGQYMGYLRAKYKGKQFDSERAVRLFVAATKKGIDPIEVAEDFEYWKNNISYLEKMPKIKNDKPHSAEDYRNGIEQRKEMRKMLNKAVGKKDV